MATKTEMIEYIVKYSDNNDEELQELNYNEVKKIYNLVDDSFNVNSNESGEDIDEPKTSKTFTIKIDDMSEEEIDEYVKSISTKFKEKVVIEKTEEVDYFTLSPAQRRAHQRSGIIPKKK